MRLLGLVLLVVVAATAVAGCANDPVGLFGPVSVSVNCTAAQIASGTCMVAPHLDGQVFLALLCRPWAFLAVLAVAALMFVALGRSLARGR